MPMTHEELQLALHSIDEASNFSFSSKHDIRVQGLHLIKLWKDHCGNGPQAIEISLYILGEFLHINCQIYVTQHGEKC